MLFSEIVSAYAHEVEPRTSQKWRHNLNRWIKLGGCDAAEQVTTDVIETWRSVARQCELSATTIEDTISDVLTWIRRIRLPAPDRGRSLRRKRQPKHVPTLDQFDSAYLACVDHRWPCRGISQVQGLRRVSSRDFWRAWLVVGYWTGLRLGDMLSLEWDDISADRLSVTAEKTGHEHAFPMHSILKAHIEPLTRSGERRVFPVATWAQPRVRRELGRLANGYGPQPQRRLAITAWTAADPEAGRIIHGTGLDVVNRHYLDALAILERHAPAVRWPQSVLQSCGMSETTVRRAELLRALHRLPEDRVETVLQVATSMCR